MNMFYPTRMFPNFEMSLFWMEFCFSSALSRFDQCLVCDDRASGIHFGVLTCEACKAFFRRTSTSIYSMTLPCSPRRCEINITNRNNCPSCRFDKCKRLGMDRENVIYGKPSSKQHHQLAFYQQEHFAQKFNEIFHELTNRFQAIHSIEHQPTFEPFAHRTFELFYEQTSPNNHSFDVMYRVFHLLLHGDKNQLLINYNLNLRMILSLWLFVYYYETFVFKQTIDQTRLILLIKLLEIELNHLSEYYLDQSQQMQIFKNDFLNTFTRFTDLLEEIYPNHQ